MVWLSAVHSWPLVVGKVFLIVDGMKFWPWKEWIEWPGWLNSLFILFGDQKIVLLRILQFKRVDISWPIRFVYLLICFRAKKFSVNQFLIRICRMFLFYVFSWLIEKYKNVTSILMRLWSEISWMFLCMFWGGWLF